MTNNSSYSIINILAVLVVSYYLLGWGQHKEYEVKTVRTVKCSHLHDGHAVVAKDCFDYAKNHKEDRHLITVKEREFHISFAAQTVSELRYFDETRSYPCQVFDADNWICPIGDHVKIFDPGIASDFSRIVMKGGKFEEYLNFASEPKRDIHLTERSTNYIWNILEFKVMQLCKILGADCKPSYNVNAESLGWY